MGLKDTLTRSKKHSLNSTTFVVRGRHGAVEAVFLGSMTPEDHAILIIHRPHPDPRVHRYARRSLCQSCPAGYCWGSVSSLLQKGELSEKEIFLALEEDYLTLCHPSGRQRALLSV